MTDNAHIINKVPREINLAIENSKLAYIEPSLESAKALASIIDANREHITPYRSIGMKKTIEEFFDVFAAAKKKRDDGSDFEYWIIHNDGIVGSACLSKLDYANKSAEISYWLDKGFVGRGLVSAAVAELEQVAFDVLELVRIVIRCDVEDEQSKKVAENANYTFEGIARLELFSKGKNKFVDMFHYSKISPKYTSR